ncbi:MAG: hypothetical protein EBY30_16200, partial [Rhodospirillales bacterium]|nr:hypothetical protein [Rhodospirillales bacterium]
MSGRVMGVASGKGGVGKTVLAIGLAQALAEAGERVLLIDADLGLANVDVQLGLPAGPDLGMVLAGRLGLAAALHHHPGGFAVLPGRSGSGALAAGSWVSATLSRLASGDGLSCGCGSAVLSLLRGPIRKMESRSRSAKRLAETGAAAWLTKPPAGALP